MSIDQANIRMLRALAKAFEAKCDECAEPNAALVLGFSGEAFGLAADELQAEQDRANGGG